MSTTGNPLEPLAALIADAVVERLRWNGRRLMTVKESAVYLGRTPSAIRSLIRAGTLPVVREGRSVHLDKGALDAWIEMRQSQG